MLSSRLRSGVQGKALTVAILLFVSCLAMLSAGPPRVARAEATTLYAAGATETTVTVTWIASTDPWFTDYAVYYNFGSGWQFWLDLTNRQYTTVAYYGLSPGTTTMWEVMTFANDLGSPYFSNVVRVTTTQLPTLQIEATNSTTAFLSWEDQNTYSSFVPFDYYTISMNSSQGTTLLTQIYDPSQTTYNATGLDPSQVYAFRVCDEVGSSNTANSCSNYAVFPPLSATESASPTTIDLCQSVLLTSAAAGGVPPYGYQWYSNGTALTGGSTSNFTFTPAAPGTYDMRLVVTDSWGDSDTLKTISIVVNPPPAVSISASATAITLAQRVNLLATVSNGTSPYRFQWYSNGLALAGANSSSFTFAPTSAGTYTLSLTVSDSANENASSNEATIIVNLVPTSLSLSVPSSATMGGSVNLSAKIVDDSGTPLAGQTVGFSLDGYTIGENVSDSSGIVWLAAVVDTVAGDHLLQVVFPGTSYYAESSANGSFTVQPLHLAISTPFPDSQVVTVNGTRYTSDSSGRISVVIGQMGAYVVSLVSPFSTGSGARAVFVSWSDGSSANPMALEIRSNVNLTAYTKIQYQLGVQSPQGSQAGGSGWYDSGATANASVSYVWGTVRDTRSSLVSYAVDGGTAVVTPRNGSGIFQLPCRMDAPHSVVFGEITQYLLAVSGGSDVTFGTPSPTGDGWYDEGMATTVSSDYIWGATNSARTRLSGWSLDGSPLSTVNGSGTFTISIIPMTSGHSVILMGATQYYLNITTSNGAVEGSGWFDEGSLATFSVVSTGTPAGILTWRVFNGWSGDSNSKSATASVTVDSPKTIEATWRTDSTMLYLVFTVAIGATAAASVLFLKIRSRRV
jgi:hypothetical protein